MAIRARVISGQRKLVTCARSQRRQSGQIIVLLYVASDALIGDEVWTCEARARMSGRPGGNARWQKTHCAEQYVVLRRVMRRPTGGRPRSAAMIVALSANVDVRVILAREVVRG